MGTTSSTQQQDGDEGRYVFEPSATTHSLTVVPKAGAAPLAQRFPVNRIYCVGRNYWDHGIEMGGDPSREPPFFFMKTADQTVDCAGASDVVIPYPRRCTDFHYEAWGRS